MDFQPPPFDAQAAPADGADAEELVTVDDVSRPVCRFIIKLFDIFSMDEYNTLCGWKTTGDSIVIKHVAHFSKFVLPKYFKHNNFSSFVRQLNM